MDSYETAAWRDRHCSICPLFPLWAAPKSVTLAVPGMTCLTCPVTIKKALMKEQGVASVTVRYEKKELIVSFDDAKTTPDAIMKSTAAVGFPSQIAR
ncbi:MAG TPA: cation transporter [Edaphobacter sp.]|nr:cation transporter [Edaphobacter sp.]